MVRKTENDTINNTKIMWNSDFSVYKQFCWDTASSIHILSMDVLVLSGRGE